MPFEKGSDDRLLTLNGCLQSFYRQAGDPKSPVLILGHGYPSSSFQYRNLMTQLADTFHVIAPDFPGFGFTQAKAGVEYDYTFANLAKTMEHFVDAIGISQYGVYLFDYSAPVLMR